MLNWIKFDKNGNLISLLDETQNAINFSKLGVTTYERAGNVEPDPDNPSQWEVNLQRCGGPIIKGFKTNTEAKKFEDIWIKKNILCK